ncbi:zinc metalloprotease [Streptomyces goshikiensis]|uniref:hypothetical protein n=1 Tax=Streptomyces goshikiensis TaxID=1942 RepID=UPI003662A44F
MHNLFAFLAAASVASPALPPAPPATATAAYAACWIQYSDGQTTDSRGKSSVDNGEITYDDSTSLDGALSYAVKAWDFGEVKIRKDDSTSYADVEFKDTNRTDGAWAGRYGYWEPGPGTDVIWLNRAYLLSASTQKRIAAHELGHALGFCHKDYRKYATLMAPHSGDMASAPTAQDKKNYTALWG